MSLEPRGNFVEVGSIIVRSLVKNSSLAASLATGDCAKIIFGQRSLPPCAKREAHMAAQPAKITEDRLQCAKASLVCQPGSFAMLLVSRVLCLHPSCTVPLNHLAIFQLIVRDTLSRTGPRVVGLEGAMRSLCRQPQP